MTQSAIVEIDITQLSPDPSQPRKVFDENAISSLREDIKANGLREPIDINPLLDGRKTKYLIIDGECRFHAIEGIDDFGLVPCKLHTYKSQRKIDKHRASKHFHRRDWNPADRAEWLKYYTETHKLRQQDLAREFSVTHSTISQWLAPTRDPSILKALRNEEIGFTQAIILSRVDDRETRENALRESIGRTKRDTEEIVNRLHSTPESEEIDAQEGLSEGELTELPVHDGEGETTENIEEKDDDSGREPLQPSSPETTGIVAQTLGVTVPHEGQEKGTEEVDSESLVTTQSPLPEGGIDVGETGETVSTPPVVEDVEPPPETKPTEPVFVRKVLKEFEAIKKLSEPDERKVVSSLNSDDLKTAIRTSRKTGENWLCLSARLRSASNGESYEMAKLICTHPCVKSLTVSKISSTEFENAKSTLTQMKKTIDDNLNLLAKRGG